MVYVETDKGARSQWGGQTGRRHVTQRGLRRLEAEDGGVIVERHAMGGRAKSGCVCRVAESGSVEACRLRGATRAVLRARNGQIQGPSVLGEVQRENTEGATWPAVSAAPHYSLSHSRTHSLTHLLLLLRTLLATRDKFLHLKKFIPPLAGRPNHTSPTTLCALISASVRP